MLMAHDLIFFEMKKAMVSQHSQVDAAAHAGTHEGADGRGHWGHLADADRYVSRHAAGLLGNFRDEKI